MATVAEAEVTFGCAFSKPIEKVMWPLPLQPLAFGVRFNQLRVRCFAADVASKARVQLVPYALVRCIALPYMQPLLHVSHGLPS